VRTPWHELPGPVQAAVIRACGAEVVAADPPVTSGFSGGSASVLHLADGRQVFAKAGYGANEHLLQAYRQEAEVLSRLPAAVPAPGYVGRAEVAAGVAGEHGWQVVVSQGVSGRMPMPWDENALAAVHAACLASAAALTPVPAGLGTWGERGRLPTMIRDYAHDPEIRGALPAIAAGELELVAGQPHWLRERMDELQDLVELAEVALAGSTACHCDLRADNILVVAAPGGGERAVFVDWNFLAVGPTWTDFVGLLPLARLDGVDVDAWVARSPLTDGVPADHLDAWVALIAAYMLANAPQPLWPGGTPAIRVHQARYARAFLDWLAARRGWE